jgi:ferric-dicitrate binding protein FerR (iron transport regulator)
MDKNSYNRAKGILREYFSQDIGDEELVKRFREWLSDGHHWAEKMAALSDLYEEMVEFDKEPDETVYLDYERLKKALRLIDKTKKETHHKHNFIIANIAFRRIWRGVAAAAVLVAIAGGVTEWFFYQRGAEIPTVSAGVGGETSVHADNILVEAPGDVEMALPDGSFVYMRKASSLTYSKDFAHDRSLTLKGEAHFKVNKKKGASPFTVNTDDMAIVAIGTEFKVQSYNRERYTVVWLYEGGLDIHRGAELYPLAAGEQLIYDKELEQVNVKRTIIETPHHVDDVYHFENEPLRDIFEWIETHYGVPIEMDYTTGEIEDYPVTMVNFERNISLDAALQNLSIMTRNFGYNIVKDADGQLRVKVFAVKTM